VTSAVCCQARPGLTRPAASGRLGEGLGQDSLRSGPPCPGTRPAFRRRPGRRETG